MNILEYASGMMAFSTFVGVMFAGLYYLYQIVDVSFLSAFLFVLIYINLNFLYLLYLRRF